MTVWDALRDVGAIHKRLAPGFVTDVRLGEGSRLVTFGNGLVVRELIVDVDQKARRLVWSAVEGPMTHWIADLLPHELAPTVAAMMDQGLAVIKQTLEAQR